MLPAAVFTMEYEARPLAEERGREDRLMQGGLLAEGDDRAVRKEAGPRTEHAVGASPEDGVCSGCTQLALLQRTEHAVGASPEDRAHSGCFSRG